MTLTNKSRSRKPLVALMGEFSAGKSTLANLLLGEALSPIQATATQVPPILYRHGEAAAFRTRLDGTQEPLDPGDLRSATPGTTKMITIQAEADFLRACDLVDMPGTSDPNMPADTWDSLLPEVDCVLWCTPATQAWRQSEAALWERVAQPLRDRSLLVVTRMDKILTERDRLRVLRRVQQSVDGLFLDVLPAMLLPALKAADDPQVLEETGVSALIDRLAEVIDADAAARQQTVRLVEAAAQPLTRTEPSLVQDAPESGAGQEMRVMPRRVVMDGARTQRPRHEAGGRA
ncbi:dynamin family protein [Thetidibacter halocola]|uniref:Dynamin N-terminal domain-containing protein n=1 Tax=Thetidibacter halocola TaxID=2827239 RepID=A0A8J8B6T9_9RHOB|nr:dynamin family protein [Thetidibacter halocola]MBS0123692.1 hypothetical protein [Thetidibacter halocola]